LKTKHQIIDKNEKIFSVREQCDFIELSRSSMYYNPVPAFSDEDLIILNKMDEIFTEKPFYGHRKIWKSLNRLGYSIGKDRVNKYMKILGLEVFYPKPKTSIQNKEHKIYSYLLKQHLIDCPNKVWSTDITYIKMTKGFCYLVAIIDWYSRFVLSHRLSNTLDTRFCIECLEDALNKYPKPLIFNTDQGCQFTSNAFTNILEKNLIQISMDSVGRAIDNIIIERFWRSIKYENIYLNDYQNIQEVKLGVKSYISFYNTERLHQSLMYMTPSEIYFEKKEVTHDDIILV
jgi:putative transposase